MDLLALSAFQQVAAHGGIGLASRATGQPKTTLSRRLRDLEEELGVRLVERGPKVFRLTEEGLALNLRTRDLLAEIEEAGQAVAGGLSHPRGRLRVSAPGLFADMHMGRIAAAFVAAYPEVELDVSADDRFVDPVVDGFDLVVRVNPHPDETLVGRCILREPILLVAPPSLPKPMTRRVESARRHVPAVVLPNAAQTTEWSVEGEHGREVYTARPVLHVSSILMALQAVRGGAGAAPLPSLLVEDDLAAGTLVSWGTLVDREVEIWVLHTSRRLRSPKVAAFVDFLYAAFQPKRPAATARGSGGDSAAPLYGRPDLASLSASSAGAKHGGRSL